MNAVYRTCTLCDGLYVAGTYAFHAAEHTPKRKGRQGLPPDINKRLIVTSLASTGMGPSEISRVVGVSRQRVHQILAIDANGRRYRADAENARRRSETQKGDAA